MSVGEVEFGPAGMQDKSPDVAAAGDETPKRRLDRLFADQVLRTPDAIALIHRGTTVRYGELDARANRLAHHLRALGAGRGTLVGVCLERSPELVVALLAVLKAGGGYVPLDPKYPADRLNFTLDDSAAALLISRTGIGGNLAYMGRRIDLDLEAAAIEAHSATTPEPLGDADDLAYVIYTSGSTGQPKGVMLSHSAGAVLRLGAANVHPGRDVAGRRHDIGMLRSVRFRAAGAAQHGCHRHHQGKRPGAVHSRRAADAVERRAVGLRRAGAREGDSRQRSHHQHRRRNLQAGTGAGTVPGVPCDRHLQTTTARPRPRRARLSFGSPRVPDRRIRCRSASPSPERSCTCWTPKGSPCRPARRVSSTFRARPSRADT